MPKRSWLLTAFNPFLGRDVNHSMTVLDRVVALHRESQSAGGSPGRPELELHTLVLPTEYDRCELVLIAEIYRLQAAGVALEGVLSLGEGKDEFKIETQANNLDHAPVHPDNAGTIRTQHKIFSDRDALLPLDFPVGRFKIPTSVNPGFFVCNHLCARMSVAREKDPALPPFGFVHVPRSDLAQKQTTEHCAQAIYDGLIRDAT